MGLWEMTQKFKNLISSTCMGQKQYFFIHISCKIYFILLVGPLQLNLKIAIFLSFVREKNAFYSEKWQLSVCVLFLDVISQK